MKKEENFENPTEIIQNKGKIFIFIFDRFQLFN